MYNLGFDIGGTKCAVLLGDGRTDVDKEKIILKKIVFPTGNGPDATLDTAFGFIDDIFQEFSLKPEQINGIGISCGGPLDAESGRILGPPNLVGWDDVPVVDLFQRRYHIDTHIENDANACAVAEWKFGAAKGCRNAIFLTFGTGMGAGIILNGGLYRGTNSMAGEVGHIRLSEFGPVGYGKIGSFEGFCSGGGIAQLAKQMVLERLQIGEKPPICPSLAELPNLTAKSVGDAADNGDPLAREIYEISGRYLGRGLAVLIDILNPEMIAIGSIYQRSEHLLRPEMMKVLEHESLGLARRVCKIVPSALGDNIGDYAALSLALLHPGS